MPNLPRLFSRPVRTIHCVGVGGMGLGPLAIYLAGAGYEVSGEDEADGGFRIRIRLPLQA